LPSQALYDLEERLEEIGQLFEAHGALTRLKRAEAALQGGAQSLQEVAPAINALVSPPGPGRPAEVQALNKAAIALLSAHLQGYFEDLFKEIATALLDGAVPSLESLVTQAPTRGNPNWDNINRLFAAVGFSGVLDGLSWQRCSNATLKTRLRDLNELRNRIVHGRAEPVRKKKVENYSQFVRVFATRFDRKVAREFRNLKGTDPW
jgi:hypothetical protein